MPSRGTCRSGDQRYFIRILPWGGSVAQGVDDGLGGGDEAGGNVAAQLFFDLVLVCCPARPHLNGALSPSAVTNRR